ncbi:MAG: hypothetical protein KDI88_13505 [Gammaproteobacteria bacterium]|nr:hypothetical protein [Gammaproteobacteria bacterium]
MVEDGHETPAALVRATRELGLPPGRNPPSADEIQAAIAEHRALFRPQQHQQLTAQRELAREAMQALAEFRPRLFGSLVDGSGPLERIRLLLECDSAEAVMMALQDRHIPWQESEVELNYSGGRRHAWPALRFRAGDSTVELVIVDAGRYSDPPFDPLTGARLRTLDADELA